MKPLHKEVFLLVILAALALSVQAAEQRAVLIVADLERGMALVPDGVEFPQGVVVKGRDQKPLVFTHAPDVEFAAARSAIAANAPWGGPAQPFLYERKTPGLRAAADKTFRAATNEVTYDVWSYVYFIDGSWVGSRRWVRDNHPGVDWGVQTATYTPENDYYNGSLYSEQVSEDLPYFNESVTCTINYAGGSCYTPLHAVGGPYTSAHVTSHGHIHHHRLPICGRYYEPPCEDHYDASIEVYFP